jgi:hypothetical protein
MKTMHAGGKAASRSPLGADEFQKASPAKTNPRRNGPA